MIVRAHTVYLYNNNVHANMLQCFVHIFFSALKSIKIIFFSNEYELRYPAELYRSAGTYPFLFPCNVIVGHPREALPLRLRLWAVTVHPYI